MAGRKPLPTNVKIMRGNPGRRPLNKFEPHPEGKIPSCPKILEGEARKEWRRMARELHRIGLVTTIDRAALSAYCQLWGRWIEAEEKLRDEGTVITGAQGGPVLNPNLRIAQKAIDQMRTMLVEFGMTPSSRSRISTRPANQNENEEKFFKKAGQTA